MTFIKDIFFLITNYYPLLLEGIWNTLLISTLGTIFGIALGLLLAIAKNQEIHYKDSGTKRFFKRLISLTTTIYIDVVRGTPMLVQAAVFYYGLAYGGININPITAGIIVVSLNTTAYIAEVIRSGINGINSGQMEAARAVGLSRNQAMFKIILPQAVNNTIPALMNELIVNVKDTSILSIIGVTELFYMAKGAASETYLTFQAYVLVAIIYLILTRTLTGIFTFVMQRFNQKQISIPQSQTVPEVI